MSMSFDHRWVVGYEDFLLDVRGRPYQEVAAYLLQQLPYEWRDNYIAMTRKLSDISIVTEDRLSYLFDFHDEPQVSDCPIPAEAVLKEARLVAAYGYVTKPTTSRPASSSTTMLGFVGRTEQHFGGGFDKGHFIAHTLGGSVNINLFPQARHINRGWSSEGKVYRQMERYCCDNPSVMLFSRPLYSDYTARPAAIEFGVLRTDGTLWVQMFTNRPEYARNKSR